MAITQGNSLSNSYGLAFLASGSPSESESWPSNSLAFGRVRGGSQNDISLEDL